MQTVDLDESWHNHLVAILLEQIVELSDSYENGDHGVVQDSVVVAVQEKGPIHHVHEQQQAVGPIVISIGRH